MGAQEGIREGIARRLAEIEGYDWEYTDDYKRSRFMHQASEWCAYLHSQGVVIKVDKELPVDEIYYVEFGHYEDTKWVSLKTKKANFMELV